MGEQQFRKSVSISTELEGSNVPTEELNKFSAGLVTALGNALTDFGIRLGYRGMVPGLSVVDITLDPDVAEALIQKLRGDRNE